MKTVSIRELHAKTGKLVRRAAMEGGLFVTDNGRTIAKIVPESDSGEPPYFARRDPSKAFHLLDKSGKAGRGMDSTQIISEDREDRI